MYFKYVFKKGEDELWIAEIMETTSIKCIHTSLQKTLQPINNKITQIPRLWHN